MCFIKIIDIITNNTYAMENSLPETKKSAKNIIGNNNSKDISKAILKNI